MADYSKTTLYEQHKLLGAKIVPFSGWLMPLSYRSVLEEHNIVRTSCGLFDVSHMGEIFVEGDDSERFLNWLTINDVKKLKEGRGQYTAILNHEGGVIDDLLLYKLSDKKFLLCVNASNIQKDYVWISEKAHDFNVTVHDKSDEYAQFALQGPKSLDCLKNILPADELEKAATLKYTQICEVRLVNTTAYIARTGYTGEKGYEIYLKNHAAIPTWNALINGDEPVLPIGLGARDTLRLEACYLLYGNDMDETISPLEAGISWAVKIEKGPFIGRDRLVEMKEAGVPRKLIAFKLLDKGVARQGMELYLGDEKIGYVTSGSVLPTLGGSGGMALVNHNSLKVDDKFEIDVRGKRKSASVLAKPLYQAKTHS